MKKCPQCGAENPDNYKFCSTCGAPLEETQALDAKETIPLHPDAAEGDTIPTDQLTPVTVSADAKSTPESMPRIMTEAVARPVVSPEADEQEGKRRGGRKKKKDREHHPGRVIGGIAAVVVLAAALGGTGYLGWSYIQKQDQEIAELKAQVKELEEKNSSSNAGSSASGTTSSTSGTGSSANSGTGSATVSDSGSTVSGYTAYASYVGTWTGTLQQNRGCYSDEHKCYGASDKPLVLEFKSIADSGQATVVAHVLYHGHKVGDLSNDAASSDGDSYLTTDEITTTFNPNDGFSFSYTPSGAGTEVEVKASPVTSQSDNATQFKVDVTSVFGGSTQFYDTYTITKSAS